MGSKLKRPIGNELEILDLQVASHIKRHQCYPKGTKSNRPPDRQEGSGPVGWKGHEENMNLSEW